MKKLMLLLGICLLLTACAAQEETVPPTCAETPAEEQPTCGPGVPYGMTCRIVDGADSGKLLLAEYDGAGIYTLDLSDTVKWKLDTPLENGQLLTIYYQSLLENWPGQFHEVSEVSISQIGFDDRCALYLQVLEDLWNKDSGLNGGVEIIGVDLSQTSLSPSEQSAVAWAFSGAHNAEPIAGTLQELMDQGYITATPLSTTGSGADLNDPKYHFYEWENGCHYSIVEQPMEGTYSLVPDTFDAQKWRSSLGAYYFADCTALQSALGEWSEYTIGSEMIS